MTTDFRAVYEELLAKTLDTDPARILTGAAATTPLGFLWRKAPRRRIGSRGQEPGTA